MHKLNALRTMMQSIIYTFSSGYLWMLMSGVFFAQVLLQIGYRTVSERYPGAEYCLPISSLPGGIWLLPCRCMRKNAASKESD